MEFGAFFVWLIVATLSPIGAFAFKHFVPDSTYKLPTKFTPISYTLDITTLFAPNFTFHGVVNITLACQEPESIIVVQQSTLDIDKGGIIITDSEGKDIMVCSVWFQSHLDKMYINSPRTFQPGEHFVLSIPFSGQITDEQVGYYRSSYVDIKTNRTRWLAVTQFEPAHARRAFPCFDEPEIKAKFKIKLRHKKGLASASNMRLLKTSPDPNKPEFVIDEFEESTPISTYLVAYMVSEFVSVDSGVLPHMPFRILTRKDAVGQAELARTAGPLTLHYYDDYLGQKLMVSKLDLVAVPDLASRATDNWGLVFFRESSLLIDPKGGTFVDSYHVARVIAHELAHMWFGHLITMKWWSDLWLNEGLAKYFAARALNKLYPTWKTFQMEMVENHVRLLNVDSVRTAHSLSMAVSEPDEFAQIFDTTSYTKGSNLLHMINQFLGEKTFKQGFRNYVRKHKSANADRDDLWNALTDEAHRVGSLPKNMTLKAIMDPWTTQTGYPVLIVLRDYLTGNVTIYQERYLKVRSHSRMKSSSCWWVPLTMTISSEANFNNTKPYMWLNCENKSTTMYLDPSIPWVIFNLQMAGMYRVNYDLSNWMFIIYTLESTVHYKTIPTLNRAQLVDDVLAFAKSGYLHYSIAIKLCHYLENEEEYIPWMVGLRGLSQIDRMFKRKQEYPMFQTYMLRILTQLYYKYHDFTVELQDVEEMRLKNLVLTQVCYNEYKNCTEQAKELFQKWMKTPDPDSNNILPKELRPTIYCEAAKYGGEKVWDFLFSRYNHSNVESEKLKYLWGLSCSMEAWKLKKLLDWTIDKPDLIRKQDALYVFESVSLNYIGHFLAKDFLFKRFEDISRYFHPRGDLVGKYVEIIGTEMKTGMELFQLRELIKNNTVPFLKGAEISVSKTIETVQFNIVWMKKYYDHIVEHIDYKDHEEHTMPPNFTPKHLKK